MRLRSIPILRLALVSLFLAGLATAPAGTARAQAPGGAPATEDASPVDGAAAPTSDRVRPAEPASPAAGEATPQAPAAAAPAGGSSGSDTPAGGEPAPSPAASDSAATPAGVVDADTAAGTPAAGAASDEATAGNAADAGTADETPVVFEEPRDEKLPHDLSPLGMFMAADWVVKAVMIGLAFASLVTWTIGLSKAMELALITNENSRALYHAHLLDEILPQGSAHAHVLWSTGEILVNRQRRPADAISVVRRLGTLYPSHRKIHPANPWPSQSTAPTSKENQ